MRAPVIMCPDCHVRIHRRIYQAGHIWECRCGWKDAHAFPYPEVNRVTRVANLVADIPPGEERLIRRGASRYYLHKLAARYPDVVWRQERVTLMGGKHGCWDIYAARPATVLA
jgi:hypothetical protein